MTSNFFCTIHNDCMTVSSILYLYRKKWVRENPYPGIFLSTNPTKWSNTLKQFVDSLLTYCLSVLDHFVGFVLKELKGSKLQKKKVSQDPLYRSTSKLLYLDIFPSTLYQNTARKVSQTISSDGTINCENRMMRQIVT